MQQSEFTLHPWRELQRLQEEARRALDVASGHRTIPLHQEGLPLNVAVSEEGARLTAVLPGVDAATFDVTILGETLTLKGSRRAPSLKEGETFHRRERLQGDFSRTVQLPFQVDSNKVQAHYKNGILELILPRSAEDRPQRIAVKAASLH